MKNIVRLLEDIDVNLIQFTDDKKPSKGLIKIMYPSYDDTGVKEKLIIQLPMIDVNERFYGVPRIDQFHKTDLQRDYIKLPLIEEQIDLLQKIDIKLSHESFKQIIFGDKWKKYYYCPLVQEPENKTAYMKVKLDMDKESEEIKTQVYLNKDSKHEEVEIDNINDIALYVNNSRVLCIVKATKLWLQSATQPSPKYGLTLKVVKILVDGERPSQQVMSDLDFII